MQEQGGLFMKNYTITVNGNTYQVSVEEGFVSPMVTQPAPVYQAVAPVQAATPAPQTVSSTPAPAVSTPASGSVGKEKVDSPMPGKILSIKVNVGQSIKKGDVLVILEAMKMENEIVAPQDGSIASVDVSAGQSVEAGDLLVTID
mgnify:CR=1 FL=1